ncbi:MAG TPA: Mur ligase family protein [Planctomycetota bacterium]|nr:Mur ligase family protein [Planctomycetota bacterium]
MSSPSGDERAPDATGFVAARLARARPVAGQRVIVLGLGHFGGGLGAARWLLAQGARVTVTDKAGRELLAGPAAELEAGGARVVLGGHAGVDFADTDLLVVNPAVPLSAPPVLEAAAAGVPLSSEIGLLMERWPGPVLGVTGSNGKSTTTSLAHAILEAAGIRSALGGNIGGSLLEDLPAAQPGDVAVLELSSFMLDMLARQGLGPDIALITNITPNHLDRHGSFTAYKESKRSILAHARRAVLNADDSHVVDVARGYAGEKLWYGLRGHISVSADGELTDRRGWPLIASAEVPLPGRMNRMNIAAATPRRESSRSSGWLCSPMVSTSRAHWRAPSRSGSGSRPLSCPPTMRMHGAPTACSEPCVLSGVVLLLSSTQLTPLQVPTGSSRCGGRS